MSAQVDGNLQPQARAINNEIPIYSVTCVGHCGAQASVCGLEGGITVGGQTVIQCKCNGCYMEAQIDGVPVDDHGQLPLDEYDLFLPELNNHILEITGNQEFIHKSLELGTGVDRHYIIHDYLLPDGSSGSIMFYEGPDTK